MIRSAGIKKIFLLSLVSPHSADSASDHDADSISIDFFEIDFRVIDCLSGGSHGKLREQIHALHVFLSRILKGIEIFYFASEFRVVLGNVKVGDWSGTAFAIHHGLPEFADGQPDWRDCSESCNYDALLSAQDVPFHNVPLDVINLLFASDSPTASPTVRIFSAS